MTDTAKVETIRDAYAAILEAIATLKAAGIAVPQTLHKAAHALHYAVRDVDDRRGL
jgi:hypothetical protein